MKKICLTILSIVLSQVIYSQTIFNRIIEDTISQITTSVVATDTGYIFLSGTGNELGIRSFALSYVDVYGIRQWKKIIGDAQIQFWEGWFGDLQQDINQYSVCGSCVNTNDGKRGIHISNFDSVFNLSEQQIILYDICWKKAFYHIKAQDNYYYITGQINPTGEASKLLLLKADSMGNYMWHKVLGNYTYEYGSFVLETSGGNILTGGETWLSNINNTKWYLVNTDTAGNIVWERYYGRNNYNNGYITSMLEMRDTNILACGSYPAAKYGSGGDQVLWDGCLRKIDMDGNLVWEKLYRNYSCHPTGTNITLSGSVGSIEELENGDLILCGSSQWYYTILRGYLIKTDPQGNIKWKRYYYADDYTSTWQYFSSFKSASDGGYIIAGYGDNYSNQGYDPPQQAWLVKTDSLGMDGLCNIEPDELNVDIDLPEVPQSICMNDTINVYVHIAGKSAPYTIEFSTGQVIDSIYYPPTFVPIEIGLTDINLTWGGETYFEESITEATLSNHEWGQCIAKPVEFHTPTTTGLHNLQITVTDAYGESKTITKDVFVVQCSTYNSPATNQGTRIYPNPATKILTVFIPGNTSKATAVITDVLGRVYGRYDLQGKESEIDISHLQPGNYFLQITFNGKTKNLRFVKE